ncbi:glycoside hydrolase family 3 N-terminal domain-containing protein [Mycolicibacterium thermoresistibile]
MAQTRSALSRLALSRRLCALVALPGLALACSPAAEQAAGPEPAPPAVATAPAATPLNTPLPAVPPPAGCGDAQTVLASMELRDKLAQLLMVGVSNAGDARAVVDNHRVGGIFVGSWSDLSMLSNGSVADIAAAAGPFPLAVSVDEEGGRVSRLSGLIGAQPAPRSLAQSHTPEQVQAIARERGQAMRNLGITVDFAPVVDVTDAAGNSVIGDRSFGADPETVTAYAGAYARGLREGGVMPVLKHFPGHGRASGDSHVAGVVTPPLAELEATDLAPYRALVGEQPAVMVGHMQVPGLTGGDPASLSPPAYQLVRSIGFGGPVFTDDLSGMRAITDRYGVPDAVLRSLQAGADVALWLSTGEVPAVLDRLENAVHAGELSAAQVDASVLRMAAAKGHTPRC